MLRRARLWLARIVFYGALLVLLILLGLYLRLLAGPLSISLVNERVTALIEQTLPGYKVRLSNTILTYGHDKVEIRAVGIALSSAQDGLSLSVPQIGLSLDTRLLLHGQLALRALNFIEPELRVDWRADFASAPSVGVDVGDGAGPANPDLMEQLLRDLPLLTTIRLQNGRARLHETLSGQSWTLYPVDMTLMRTGQAVMVDMIADISTQDGQTSRIDAHWTRAQHEGGDGGYAVTLRFEPLILSDYAAPDWPVAQMAFPLSGTVTAQLADDFQLQEARFSLTGGAGQFNLDTLFPKPRIINGAAFEGTVAGQTLFLRQGWLDLPGTRLSLQGRIDGLFSDTPVPDLTGGFDQLSIANLKTYWPPDAASGGYQWVRRNIRSGQVRDAMLRVEPSGDFSLRFDFKDLVTGYLDPMPEATGLSGQGSLTGKQLLLEIGEGAVADLTYAPSTVRLYDLDKPQPWGDLDLVVQGSLDATLALADHDPLGFVARYGLDPAAVKGQARTHVALDLPLKADLGFEEVGVVVQAEIIEADIPINEAITVSGAALSVDVTNNRMQVSGTGQVRGLEAGLSWIERFDDQSPQTVYTVASRLTLNDLAALGIPDMAITDGTIGLNMRLTGNGDGIGQGRLDLDLTDAALEIPYLDWRKETGQTAQANADMRFGETIKLDNIHFQHGSEQLSGQADVHADGRIQSLKLDIQAFADNTLSAAYETDQDGTHRLDIMAEQINLAPLLRFAQKADIPADQPISDPQPLPALALSLQALEAKMLNGVAVSNVTLSAQRDAKAWQTANLDAVLGDITGLKAELSTSDTRRDLIIRANDAGLTLRGLGFFANADGGEMELNAQLSHPDVPGFTASGEISVQDFRLVRSDTIAAVIEAGEAEGLEDIVGPNGLQMTELVLPFDIREKIIDIDKARANGPRLGLTLEGQVDQGLDRLNVNGVIIPAYRFNSIVNNIPIIGNILAGGRGEGLFALNYRISGDFADPNVEVRRLTALAPGIVRGLFETRKGRLEDLSAEETQPEATRPQ